MKTEVHTDLYAWFGVPPRASTETIRECYLQRAREMHPDKGGDVAQFAELHRVYSVLSNEGTRKTYDAQLKVSSKFPELCGVCEGVGRRRYGLKGHVPCKMCGGSGRYVPTVAAPKTFDEMVGEAVERNEKRRVSLKLKKVRDILRNTGAK